MKIWSPQNSFVLWLRLNTIPCCASGQLDGSYISFDDTRNDTNRKRHAEHSETYFKRGMFCTVLWRVWFQAVAPAVLARKPILDLLNIRLNRQLRKGFVKKTSNCVDAFTTCHVWGLLDIMQENTFCRCSCQQGPVGARP